MLDQESIIRAVETCFVNWIDRYTHTVPLSDSDLEKVRQMKEDALALLKEQKPRVITREELKQFEDSPCWFESHDTYMGKEGFWIIPYMFTCYQTMYYVFPLLSADERGNIHYSELGLSAYNKAWRCWSAKPTDEQRKAVKWDD